MKKRVREDRVEERRVRDDLLGGDSWQGDLQEAKEWAVRISGKVPQEPWAGKCVKEDGWGWGCMHTMPGWVNICHSFGNAPGQVHSRSPRQWGEKEDTSSGQTKIRSQLRKDQGQAIFKGSRETPLPCDLSTSGWWQAQGLLAHPQAWSTWRTVRCWAGTEALLCARHLSGTAHTTS